MSAGRGRPPAAPGVPPPHAGDTGHAAGSGGSRDVRGAPQRKRGKRGGLGGRGSAPAAQLLARCLTSGRRKQLGGCSSEARLVSSRCGMPANSIHLGQRAATVYWKNKIL